MWDYDVDETSRIFTIGDWLRLDEVDVMIVFAARAGGGNVEAKCGKRRGAEFAP
jgi:hypothetical protein